MFQAIYSEGFSEGELKGELKGELRILQQWLMNLVTGRFPELVSLATKYVAQTDTPALLQQTIFRLNATHDSTEAEQILRVFQKSDSDA